MRSIQIILWSKVQVGIKYLYRVQEEPYYYIIIQSSASSSSQEEASSQPFFLYLDD